MKRNPVNTNDFLMGYFFAALNGGIKNEMDFMTLPLQHGDKITFAINRGICPVCTRVGFAFLEPGSSHFDIVEDWVSEDVWGYVAKHFGHDHGEARISYPELLEVIGYFGGIDVENMRKG